MYKNLAVGFGGLTVTELNNLVINRSDGSSTDKSQVPNVFLASAPRDGQVVAAPATLASAATAGAASRVPAKAGGDATPTGGFLGFAWSGPSANLAGQNLAATAGLLAIDDPGVYSLRVAGTTVDSVAVDSRPCSRDQILCLNQERFLVEVDWRDPLGVLGRGTAAFAERDSGLAFFFSENNLEMLVKVLDGCGITDHFWVFAAATTDVEYTLRVTDTATGVSKSYFNPLGTASPAITDTSALPVCDAAAPVPPAELGSGPAIAEDAVVDVDVDFDVDDVSAALAAGGDLLKQDCDESDTNLCLNGGRFKVAVDWRTGTGEGVGQVVPFSSDDSGLLFFFNEDNWEMLIKVLNGCGINDRYWVFAAATTDVGYTLTVTDTERDQVQTYVNPLGVAADAITDTNAFATCP